MATFTAENGNTVEQVQTLTVIQCGACGILFAMPEEEDFTCINHILRRFPELCAECDRLKKERDAALCRAEAAEGEASDEW